MGSMNRAATEQLIQEVLEVYPVETGKQRAGSVLKVLLGCSKQLI